MKIIGYLNFYLNLSKSSHAQEFCALIQNLPEIHVIVISSNARG